ncbi:isopeptide-forming domain-containing fimbrial protein [Paraliobacillus salinarum]|uniref:isopeptide-forming domain-containing fimbrial protein n=1 Tax=Paraliobacillus salinarum TaxID=1158996 RepID=UPI0015F68816|nr:isopeptide-forming domain-containing fimbrial protein [Paraliobacillus salinarum]
MQRIFAMFSIFILLLMQSAPSIHYISAATDTKDFKVDVNAESTQESTELNLTSSETVYEEINISLPEGSSFDATATEEVNDKSTEFIYDQAKNVLKVKGIEPKQLFKIVLKELSKLDNVISIQGITSGEVQVEEKHQFVLIKNDIQDDEAATDVIVDQEKEEEASSQEEGVNEETINPEEESSHEAVTSEEGSSEETTKQESDTDTNTDQTQKNLAPLAEEPTGEVGDLNTYIGIGPIYKTALTGADANFRLTVKLTGSKRVYKNVDIVVTLPISETIIFDDSQDELDHLAINGVSPTFDSQTKQLTYHFDEIKRGQMYEKIISLNTKNGYIPNDTSVDVTASLTGEIHYTENDEKEEGQAGTVVPVNLEDSGTMTLKATGGISIKKSIVSPMTGVAERGDIVTWQIDVAIPKKDRGQLFLQPGENIVITDTLPNDLTFQQMISGDSYTSIQGNVITWEFPTESFAEQEARGDNLFSKTFQFETKVGDSAPEYQNLTNQSVLQTQFIGNTTKNASSNKNVYITAGQPGAGDIQGSVYVPAHLGPSDDAGGIAENDNKNPVPQVNDDAKLTFGFYTPPLHESRPSNNFNADGGMIPGNDIMDFNDYKVKYDIDKNLNIESIKIPSKLYYKPTTETPSEDFLVPPTFQVLGTVDGIERVLIQESDVAWGKTYTREEMGILSGEYVSDITIDFLYAPGGMQSYRWDFNFSVKQGYTGLVENVFNIVGVDGLNRPFDLTQRYPDYFTNGNPKDLAGPRQAVINPWPAEPEPVGRVGVKLLNHVGGVVTLGNNRMQVELENANNSLAPMNSQLETTVLLPPGVVLNDVVNPSYTDANDEPTTGGSYELVNPDYNGSGRQLVKVQWDDSRITKGQKLTAQLDVEILNYAPNQLRFDVYGFSSDSQLQAPVVAEPGITDTVLQTDSEDLNGNGDVDHPRLKSGNLYVLAGKYDIKTEKLIKGPNDTEYSKFTVAPFDGLVDYKLKMTNTTGKDLSIMTLIDVLPSLGDLGITDNINRGSTFEPILNGPITLPAEWQGKVSVFYSTAKNPERDDLTRHTDYLPNTTQLTNPAGAEAPNWMDESSVTDWSDIHSFKIELKKGDTWIKGQDIEIDFSMKMPLEANVTEEVKDLTLAPQQRAAWNSFAVATDTGQPVEPERVGVAIEHFVDIPVEKVWVGEAQDSITVKLLADGQVVDTVELTNANNWKHVFENKPALSDAGTIIKYTIEEVTLPGYESVITGNKDDGFVVTNTVKPPETPEVEKEVEGNDGTYGKDLIEKEFEKEYNYQVNTVVPENLLGYEHITLTDTLDSRLDVVSAQALVDGVAVDYEVVIAGQLVTLKVDRATLDQIAGQTLTLEITAKIKAGTEVAIIDNKAEIQVNDNPSKDSNIVPVMPPPEKPTIEKDIDGEKAEEAVEKVRGESYEYNVTSQLPANVTGYQTVTISDELDSRLTIEGTQVLVDGEASDLEAVTTGQLVTVILDETQIQALAGKEIKLVITAKINADVEIEVINNQASIQVNDNPNIDSNIVPVIPPQPPTPEVEKEVEGNDGTYGKDLVEKELEKEYNYQVNTVVPEDLVGYEHITLTDTLDSRLDIVNAQALVDGVAVDYEVVVAGQLVTLKVDRATLDQIAGQTLTLEITAKIKDGTEVAIIDNKAEIQVNDNPSVDSNIVPVNPPPEKPMIEKDIDGEKAQEAVVKLRGEEYNYNVISNLPENVTGYKTVTISDELDSRLSIQSTNILVNGVNSELEATIDGQLVTLTLNESQIKELAGSEIKLVITATINADTEIEVIDNQASIQVNDDPNIDSNIVPVIPPTKPNIDKDVEGVEHLNIDYNKEYNYNVITELPTNIEDYEKYIVTDKVDLGLVVNAAGVKATVDGQEYAGLTVTVNGNDVKVEVTDFAGLQGKGQIELVIPAKIHPDTNMDDYVNNQIPNTADLDFTNESGQDSKITTPPVTVTPPPTPDVEKEVEGNDGEFGKDLVEKELDKEYKYHVKTVIPTDLTGFTYLTLTDTLDDRLDIVSAQALVDGVAVDYEVVIAGQLVTLKVDRATLDQIAGQTLTLEITAKIKAGTEVAIIDNKAEIQVNDNPSKDSNIVPVMPPPEKPTIEKDIDGEKAEEAVEKVRGEAYEYNVTSPLPVNVTGYQTVTISDELDSRLTIEGTQVLVDGELSDLEAVTTGQLVTVELNKEQIQTYAGKEIKLVITAKINADVEIEVINNQASIQVNDDPTIDSNIVPVIPPGPPTPEVEKEVEGNDGTYGKEMVEKEFDKEYNYQVNTVVPEDLTGFEYLTLTDTLDDRLDVVSAKALVDGAAVDYEVVTDGQLVTLKVDRATLDQIAGQTLTLEITAKIKAGIEVAIIDNKAEIQVNDNPREDSNTVPVVPFDPPNPVEPEKPEKPETPEGPKQPNDPGQKLPNTATDMFNYQLIGIVLTLLGLISLILIRRKKE